MSGLTKTLIVALLSVNLASHVSGQTRPRARDLGIPFEGRAGALNAITDVRGVEVGHSTIIRGSNVRTGVTAVLPRGKQSDDPVFGGWFSLNGNGEMTGTAWLDESGFLESPVLITNTHSVGIVRDAVIQWTVRRAKPGLQPWGLPMVAETFDGYLNDINGFHVKAEHAFEALDKAAGGRVTEGSVGGGTGMICHEFKGGIGTASRVVGGYTVGVLVQCNYGRRGQLRIAGVPVGNEIPEGTFRPREEGSIIIVVATDAPLMAHQTKRLARRAALGLARNGSTSGNGSGDLFVAFSTGNAGAAGPGKVRKLDMLPNESMDPLFTATVQATEEAIINAMVAADTMTGRDGHKVLGLPHDRVKALMKKYGR